MSMTTSSAIATRVHRRGGLRAALHRPRMTTDFAAGDRIRDHVIVKRLGRGGFGDVYEVVHAVLGRRAAIKVLHTKYALATDIRARFEREARLVNSLRHDNIVELFEFGETVDGRPFYVMELLEGRDLEAELRARGRLSPAEAIERLGPVLDALAAVHAAGVVHRDIKPSNVFVTATGRTVLLDFGIAKPLSIPALTRSHQQLGTPAYMAPEQILGKPIDARSDLYAIATMAFELLTGRLPFADESPRVMQHRHLHAERELPSRFVPEIPAALDAVLAKAMAIDPADRYASARELDAALRDAITPRGVLTGTRSAVAIYLEVTGGDEASADAMFERAKRRLAECGFLQAFECASSLLVACPLAPGGDEHDRLERAGTMIALAAELFAHATAAGLSLELAVHAGEVEWTDGTPIGGALMQLDWVAGRPGLHISPALLTT